MANSTFVEVQMPIADYEAVIKANPECGWVVLAEYNLEQKKELKHHYDQIRIIKQK